MKKILGTLLLAVLCLLSGCGGGVVQEVTQPKPVEVQVAFEETERVLPYQDVQLSMQALWQRDDPCARVLEEAVVLFEKQTGAAVTVLWPGEDGTTSANTERIDIFQLSEADFQSDAKKYALDLTEMAEAAHYDEKSHEVLRQQIVGQCGYLGAVAQVPYLGGVYYNTRIFEDCGIVQTPRNWEEFLDLCRILREAGWQPLTLDKSDTLVATELHLRRTIGTEELARLMGKEAHWQNHRGAIGALEQVMSFVQEGNIAYGTPADHPAGQNKMALSGSAMMVGTNATCAAVEAATLVDLDWGVFPYPGDTSSGTWIKADVLMIHKDSPNSQAAFDFLMLLATGEFDQLRADLSEGIPADPANASVIDGAMEALAAAQPVQVGLLGRKQQDATVKLWSGWYKKVTSYASALERSK